MGKCIICGKKGLFLKLDSKGRCNECLIKIKKEEEALKIEQEKEL